MSMPTIPTSSGVSWEVIETHRRIAAGHIDNLVESIEVCDRGADPDSLTHFDATLSILAARYEQGAVPLLAEALTRLAAVRKAARK
ncbi:hypothetical protein [Nocardia gipuzkoensis]|uniref:hypothetical protein n=1 Tax=Nocardia gipuzkoensis TaxID=2749991 RepID=UPI00245577D8|nr:hypothetical protein [Nocardia gipuzkoensis]